MRVSLPILALLMLSACRADPKPEDTGSPSEATDADGDGYADDVDCDDGDASVFPGADELCNDVDDDCDGEVDEDGGTVWYPDADGDGYAGEDGSIVACEAPNGYFDTAEDCDDDDATIHPGAGERCNGVDDDCDGEIDEDPPDVWYADNDGDGYGDATASITSCDPSSGWVDNDGDCDDSDAMVHPGAQELCNGVDDDCDEEVDEGLDVTWYADADGDGYGDANVTTAACDAGLGWVDNDLDCDDSNSSVNPLATEVCDGIDNDCDLLTDDADAGVVDPATWYYDGDADGYGLEHKTVARCDQPSGYAALGGDCDDSDTSFNPGAAETDCADPADYNCDGSTGYADDDGDGFAACDECDDLDATIFPGADERCDGADNDCDGTVDEDDAVDAGTWCTDGDGDGYGDTYDCTVTCTQPVGTVTLSSDHDCDDTAATVNPGATEICNGIDDDCDALVDDDDGSITGQATWYADADSDGYGDAASTTLACSQPSGSVADSSDCDDGDSAVNPAAAELCNGVDDDCDAVVDEDDATDVATWYADADGDSYGEPGSTDIDCDQPSGFVADSSDCDDGDSAVNPAATELCNGVDDDCNGSTDEETAADASTWYADDDGDGYGDAGDSTAACSAPSGYLADATDCDDGDGAVNPGATELCDGVDNDCDGSTDEDSAADASTWYADDDGDGYGDAGDSTAACSAPSGYVADATDCDDGDGAVNPGATELCNGVDDDCDGSTDEDSAADANTWYADDDGDGYGDAGDSMAACSAPGGYLADATDCDDGDGAVNPAATEQCNGVDDDCDGSTDEDSAADASTWYADDDGDGYGDAGDSTAACSAPSGYLADATDCDDGDGAVNPGATELCDGVDNDCDGSTDEDSAADASTWYADADSDGYGDAASTYRACSAPSGYVADASDCDDSDGDVHPGATETCSGVDDDCDGTVDEPADLLGSDAACGAVNCNEILSTRSSAPDGEYWLEFDGSSLQVFCDMTTAGGGWNVIHPDDLGNLGSLDAMRDELDTAMAYLRHSSGTLYYTELFQLTAYAAYDVDVSDYDSTRTRITFIPISVAAVAGVTQGFTSNGSELTFTNCDANPNSYIEFWHTGDSYTWNRDYTMSLMWRDSKLPASVAVPSDYFTFTAIHQGGCGTHSTSPYWVHYDGMQDAALAVR